MKVLILLSAVAWCSCLPATRSRVSIGSRYGVDVDYTKYNAYPVYNFWNTWNQQHRGQEPWNQWVEYGIQNQPDNYWRQYVLSRNQAENVDLPWMYHYWDVQDFKDLSPVQRIRLLLNHVKLHQQWNQWNHDVTDNEYLQNMLLQHIPEYVRYSHEEMVPYVMHYFNQYPTKYNEIMHEVVQTTWTHQQLLFHVMSELYRHYGQAPWSHEQILNYIMEHQYIYGSPLSEQQLEQLVEFVHHIQYELTPIHYQQLKLVEPWNREQVLPWNRERVLPWTQETVHQKYEHVLPWNHEEVFPWTYEQVLPWNYKTIQQRYEHVQPEVYQQYRPWNYEKALPWTRQYGQYWNSMQQPRWWNQQWTKNIISEEHRNPIWKQQVPLVY